MSSKILDNFTTLWTPGPGVLWSVSGESAPDFFGQGQMQMVITSGGGPEAELAPYVQREFDSPLDLSTVQELRFWMRSSLPGDGGRKGPFYLRLDVVDDLTVPSLTWSRLLPVVKVNTWELHQLWLENMPVGLRTAVGGIRLQGLTPEIAFSASVAHLLGAVPELLSDVDAALLAALDTRFQVMVDSVNTDVPAVIALPENPAPQEMPHILITPWSVTPGRIETQRAEIIDNFTSEGAFVRPLPKMLQLGFSVDVFAQQRDQKTSLLERVIHLFHHQPYLLASGERLQILPFIPSRDEVTAYVTPGRTPLFYRLNVWAETGAREFRAQAVPLLTTGPIGGEAIADVMAM